MDVNARTAEGVVTLSAGFEHKGAQTQYHFAVVGLSASGDATSAVKLKLKLRSSDGIQVLDDGYTTDFPIV